MKAFSLPVLCVLLISCANLAQAESVSPACKALVRSRTGLYLVAADGVPADHFPPVEISPWSEVALSPSGSRIAFIPRSAPDTFVVMDNKGRSLNFPADRPAPNSTRNSHDDPSFTSMAQLIGISWGSDGVIRLEKNLWKNASRFEFYRFAGRSNHLIQVARPDWGTTCVTSPVGGRVACLDENFIKVDGRTVFSADRSAASHLAGSITLGVGESAFIPGTSNLSVQVLSVSTQAALRVTFPTGYWSEEYVPVGVAMDVDADSGKTNLELVPSALDPASGKVTLNVFSTPSSSVGFVGGLMWLMDHGGIVTIRNNLGGPELILLASNAPNGLRVVASEHVDIADAPIFLSQVSAKELYYQSATQSGLVPLKITSSGVQFGKPLVFPQRATLKLGGLTLHLPALTWSCN